MNDIIKEIQIDNRLYSIGADAENVIYEGAQSIKEKINSLPTYSNFQRDVAGLVPAPKGSGNVKYLREDGIWEVPNSSGGVAATDAVIENSLTVNGRVIEGIGHSLKLEETVEKQEVVIVPVEGCAQALLLSNSPYHVSVAINGDGTGKYKYIINDLTLLEEDAGRYPSTVEYTYGRIKIMMNMDETTIDDVRIYKTSDNRCSIAFNTSQDENLVLASTQVIEIIITHVEKIQITQETISKNIMQHAHIQGKYSNLDIENNNNYAHIVGGGTSGTDRKNIHTLDWDGNAYFAGDIVATKENGDTISLLSIAEKSGEVATIDAVIENSLTVNGYVAAGKGHMITSLHITEKITNAYNTIGQLYNYAYAIKDETHKLKSHCDDEYRGFGCEIIVTTVDHPIQGYIYYDSAPDDYKFCCNEELSLPLEIISISKYSEIKISSGIEFYDKTFMDNFKEDIFIGPNQIQYRYSGIIPTILYDCSSTGAVYIEGLEQLTYGHIYYGEIQASDGSGTTNIGIQKFENNTIKLYLQTLSIGGRPPITTVDGLVEYIADQAIDIATFPIGAIIQGKYSDLNEESTKYAHVVGGGTSDSDRKNIYTLDWNGNAMFAGDITFMHNGVLTSLSSILNNLQS